MKPVIYPASQNPKVPEATQLFRHITPIQIRFNDIDILGHINEASAFVAISSNDIYVVWRNHYQWE